MENTKRNQKFLKAVHPVAKNTAGSRALEIKTYNIHDILHGDGNCPITIGALSHLIQCQAELHQVEIKPDQNRLKHLLEKRINTVRGFVMHAEGAGPLAYSIYYPMIDREGKRVAYCEDFFITESYRGYGIAKILFHELAKHTLNDNAEYLQWATDKRNPKVHGFVQHLGAKHPNIITIAASELLEQHIVPSTLLKEGWSQANFTTKPVTPNDLHHLPKVGGLSADFIRNTGDMTFKGLITHEKGTGRIVAVTPGWIHLSTFQLKEGVHLEDPVFADMDEAQKAAITLSVIEAAKNMCRKDYHYLRWHIATDNDFMMDILKEKYSLQNDSMLGTPDSELIVYALKNGELKKLAKETPNRTILIGNRDLVGMIHKKIQPPSLIPNR